MPTIRIFKQYVRVPYILLAAIDGLLLIACLYAGSLVRFGDLGQASIYMGDVMPRALAFAAFMLIGMSAMGLYQYQRAEKLGEFCVRLAAAFGIGWLGLALLYYIYPDLHSGRSVVLLSIVVAAAVVAIVRPLFFRLLDVQGLRKRILVLGAGEAAAKVQQTVNTTPSAGLRITGFVPARGQGATMPESQVVELPSGRLAEYCRRGRVEEIILAADDRRNAFPMGELLECKLMGIRILEQTTFYEREEGRVRLEMLHPGWLVFSDGCNQNVFRFVSKRAFDVAASICVLAASLPVMLLTAILIKIEDGVRSPILYRQQRVGERGRLFEVLKFRSMRVDAEKDGKAQWAQERDPRITKVGNFIRRTRIDELPQVFNVLSGEMSFVGPRPERPQFVSQLSEEIPYYSERHAVKPGITGWAQIKYPYGASVEDARKKLEFDLFYVKNHNLMLDMYVMMTTLEVVLFGKGR
ncbi:MAG: TIGR03013 family XrtA/PEP-CTERM system glycosyltransferase [Pseudomonadota bacterium]